MYLLDFETKSGCPIGFGIDNYFQHPEADLLCMVYGHIDALAPKRWWPGCEEVPTELFEHFDTGGLVGASYAAFDQAAWEYLGERHGFPVVDPTQWYCTQAQSRVAGLPSSLDNSARAIGSSWQKSRRGAELIRKMCIPPFEHTPELLLEMVDYCETDWYTMREVAQRTPTMMAHLFEDYKTNEIVNARGVKIDREMAFAAHKYATEERAEIAGKLLEVCCICETDPAEGEKHEKECVEKPTQHARFKKWLFLSLYEDGAADAIRLMIRYKKGKLKLSSDKIVRANMLADPLGLGIAPDIVGALQLMDDAGGSATAKYQKMCTLSNHDDRVRGAIRFAGAPSTLRYSSLGLQLHNFRRDAFSTEDVLHFREQMLSGAVLTDPKTRKPVRLMDTLGKLLRGAIIPEDGNVFVVGDWSAIESRMTAWFADDFKKLDVFLRGDDPYCYAAEAIYRRPINKKDDPDERQVGKVVDLACGFLGGPGAIAAMAVSYQIHIDEDSRKVLVDSWRDRHPKIVNYGNLLSATAMKAMRSVGKWCEAGRVAYLFDGSALYCRLPDGKTVLRYPEARLGSKPAPWDPEQMIPDLTALKAAFMMGQDDTEWPRHSLWRGLLLENIVQASCAILLRFLVDIFKEYCVFHAHDEIILEIPRDHAEQVRIILKREMETSLAWCRNLPLEAEPVIMERYGK